MMNFPGCGHARKCLQPSVVWGEPRAEGHWAPRGAALCWWACALLLMMGSGATFLGFDPGFSAD